MTKLGNITVKEYDLICNMIDIFLDFRNISDKLDNALGISGDTELVWKVQKLSEMIMDACGASEETKHSGWIFSLLYEELNDDINIEYFADKFIRTIAYLNKLHEYKNEKKNGLPITNYQILVDYWKDYPDEEDNDNNLLEWFKSEIYPYLSEKDQFEIGDVDMIFKT